MGIPSFYRWISERYPLINQQIKGNQLLLHIDNLYLDLNGIIHNCIGDDPYKTVSGEKVAILVVQYIDLVIQFVQPRNLLFIAVDGVAPRAKITQQRSRRFKTAKKVGNSNNKMNSKGIEINHFFDKNAITPGTEFMQDLHENIQKYLEEKQKSDKIWKVFTIQYSGYDVPSEGEHKIIEYIRRSQRSEEYNPNIRHCFYGLDADLIILSIALHEKHMLLVREKVDFRNMRNERNMIVELKEIEWQYLHISILREYLELDFSYYKIQNYNLEYILDDLVLLVAFCGNDFLPTIPFIHIKSGSLDLLLEYYM